MRNVAVNTTTIGFAFLIAILSPSQIWGLGFLAQTIPARELIPNKILTVSSRRLSYGEEQNGDLLLPHEQVIARTSPEQTASAP